MSSKLEGITWLAQGEANFYRLMRGNHWVAIVQFNGELLVWDQEQLLNAMLQGQQASPVGEREAFEAHMRVGGYSNPDKHPDGSYVSSAMELWWQGWKARAAHQRQQPTDAALDVMRKAGLSIDGDNAYKRDLLDSVIGALAFGKQRNTPPPAGHWLERFYEIGQAEADERDHLRDRIADLEAREVVMPERKQLPDLMFAEFHESRGWNACLDEFARLNGKEVGRG